VLYLSANTRCFSRGLLDACYLEGGTFAAVFVLPVCIRGIITAIYAYGLLFLFFYCCWLARRSLAWLPCSSSAAVYYEHAFRWHPCCSWRFVVLEAALKTGDGMAAAWRTTAVPILRCGLRWASYSVACKTLTWPHYGGSKPAVPDFLRWQALTATKPRRRWAADLPCRRTGGSGYSAFQ